MPKYMIERAMPGAGDPDAIAASGGFADFLCCAPRTWTADPVA